MLYRGMYLIIKKISWDHCEDSYRIVAQDTDSSNALKKMDAYILLEGTDENTSYSMVKYDDPLVLKKSA